MYKEYFDSVHGWFRGQPTEPAVCPICGTVHDYTGPDFIKCVCGLTVNHFQPTDDVLDNFYESADAMNKWAEIKDSKHENLRQGEKFLEVWRYIGENQLKSVLDVGCGNGFFLNHMKLGGLNKVGIEPSDKAREYCEFPVYKDKELFDSSLHSALDFDMITFFGVLEHVKKPLELIASYKEYLRKDGRIAVIVPNVDSLIVNALGTECATFCPQHLWYYNIKTLSKLMLMAGFECDKWLTVEPETQPILKKLKGFSPYTDIGIKLSDVNITDMSILMADKGYKIVAFFKRREDA